MNKNILFSIALSIFGLTFAEETAQATLIHAQKSVFQSSTLSLAFSAKDSEDLNDLNTATNKLITLFESMQKNQNSSENFYGKLLVFVKELQEAVIAGLNLFGTATTSTSNAVQTVQEIAQSAETLIETVSDVQSEENAPTAQKSITAPQIKFSFIISIYNEEQQAALEQLTAKMNAAAQAYNEQTCSMDTLVEMIQVIVIESKNLGFESKINVDIVA